MLVTKNIGYQINGKTLLSDVSLQFDPGRLHLILGPNGAGKSTLIKLISGMLKPSQGQIYLGEKTISQVKEKDHAKVRAVLSQQIELPFALKVWEVVMMGRYPHFAGKPGLRDHEICEEMLNMFDLKALAERAYPTLSGGEKQRVQFARVMAQIYGSSESSLKYLILDEPLAFLDMHFQLQFMKKLRQILSQKLIVVGVIHDIHLALQFADNIVLMQHGRIVGQGAPQAIITEENLFKLYHVRTRVIYHENAPVQLVFDEV